jgi:RNA polymerase sigma factor (sigma-70 family)
MAAQPQIPHRTPAQERELLLAAQRDPDRRAEVVDAYMPLIGSVAHRYRGAKAVDRRELMQEGVVGLLRALERYDPTLGTPFWAYATWWVRQAMQQLVSELTWPVVLSDRALRQLARVKDTQRRFAQDHGREPTPTELAQAAGLQRDQVAQLMAAERAPRALEEPVSGDRDGSSVFGDLLADPAAQDPYDRVPRRHAAAQVPELLDLLSARERAVVTRHFGLDGQARTLRDIASGMGVSAERVRQVEQEALAKLRVACDAPAAS